MPRETYLITIERPLRVSPSDAAQYINTAVARWSAGGDPTDPLCDIGVVSVKRVEEVAKEPELSLRVDGFGRPRR